MIIIIINPIYPIPLLGLGLLKGVSLGQREGCEFSSKSMKSSLLCFSLHLATGIATQYLLIRHRRTFYILSPLYSIFRNPPYLKDCLMYLGTLLGRISWSFLTLSLNFSTYSSNFYLNYLKV